MQKIILIGRLGTKPELTYSQSGKAICKFSVACNEKRKGEDVTEWFNAVVFNRQAEACEQYLIKGSEVYIEGKQSTSKWNDATTGETKYKTELLVDNVQFLSNRTQDV